MPKNKKTTPEPTNAELEILQVLWEHGPSTVRQIHEQLSHRRATGYTTTLKLMQIMVGKGLLARDESNRTHLYRDAQTREKTQRQLVRSLMQRAFDGSAAGLVMQALSTQKASSEDLAEIRRLLDELES
ncbi:MAG: BlaI/MecI/CopY family transcriptional regulator [Pirellulales bacterium]|nr:BlaI/MecI/CopY family transcriptional regulator [Pirellulales bacterium]